MVRYSLCGKSEHSDWFFLGGKFTLRTVSLETVISRVFFYPECPEITN